MAKPSANGGRSQTAVASSEVPADQQEDRQDHTLAPDIVKKFSRSGEVERATREMR